MTNQEKIKYLKEYVDICKEFEEVREYYRNRIYSIQAQVITDMPVTFGSAGDVVGSKLSKLDSIDEMIDKRLKKLENKRLEIETIIDGLETSIHRRIMHLRYIQGVSWEEITVKIGYAWTHTHRIHSNIINSIKIKR